MNNQKADIHCDLMIIGTGMAGMAAALFAAGQDLDIVQAGRTGQLGFASGLIDVLGVYPVARSRIVKDPWPAIADLGRHEPAHPYAKMAISEIQTAVDTVLGFFEQAGYPYMYRKNQNMIMPTAAGTVKPTYAAAHTMAHGQAAMAHQEPCLLVDFKGLKGFGSRMIAANLARTWPGLRPVTIGFPEAGTELHPEPMARALETARMREKLAENIAPHLGNAACVALPAILGISRTQKVTEELSGLLGMPVFEISTMVPGVSGIRIMEIFQQHLPEMGINAFFQHNVRKACRKTGGGWVFEVGDRSHWRLVSARAALVCSGRFLGGGLHADRAGITETIFNLPVARVPDRDSWHHRDLLHAGGHPVNRAGLAVDTSFRPVDDNNSPVWPDLFAAGTILAGQDWMREKCGSGLSIATAYAAVRAARRFLEKT